MKLVGYCVEDKARTGEEGLAYSYILTSNGLWLEARNDLLEARVLLADVEVRGLAPLEPKLALKHGRIPNAIWQSLASICAIAYPNEFLGVVSWLPDGGYALSIPTQKVARASVHFTPIEGAVLEVHSHPDMPARFSGIDDADEQAFKLYAVLGYDGLTGRKEVNVRLGVYGYFVDVLWGEVFEGPLEGWEL